MKIYGVIPARSGSKSIKDKNIRMLGGVPVIAHSISISNQCDLIDQTIFTTDSAEYMRIAKRYGSVIPVNRPEMLATDISSDTDYLLHVVYKLELDIKDILVLLRPTTPLRELSVVTRGIKKFKKEMKNYDSMRSVHQINEPPEKMFRYTGDGTIEPYMGNTTEDANKPKEILNRCYHPNGYIDIIPVRTLIETKTTFGEKVMGLQTEKVIEIDSQDDFDYLEYRMNK